MADEKQPTSSTPNFNDLEKGVLKFWEDNKVFEKSLEKTKSGEPYIFYDGPPFATGLPHYGSILPSVIKDAIPRYQTMKGRFVRRRWGWDCHGLPIENIVEQHLKISGKKQIEEIGVDRFNQVCRDNVLTYAKEWGKTISRIGRWVEFDKAYMTMQTSYQESVWAGLKQTWEKGLIYEDRKVLLYCSRCETPISNFEVAMDNSYKDVTEESVYAKFKLHKGQRIINDLTNDKTYALAWTTTPWTLPGNTALNVGPDISYVMIEMAENGERYILAKDLLSIIDGQYETIAEFPARSLEGLQYEPLYPGVIPDSNHPDLEKYNLMGVGDFSRAHKIYLADFVTTTDGTGIVHNAAMYGEEDYQLAKQKNLPRIDMLDNKGHYLPMAPEHLRGVFFKGADKIILKELKEQGKVYKTLSYTHSYPHCYRCATPLFYNALPAWFINIQKVKQDLVKNNEDVTWYPEHLKHGRFKLGLENAPDWNISRNRFWATALPFWKCENKECKNLECIGSVVELIQKSVNFEEVYPEANLGYKIEDIKNANLTSYILNLESLDLHRPYIDQVKLKCEKCSSSMQRVPEVVDCWVESGSMPFAELHYPFENNGDSLPEDFKNRFPADFVVEYIPQTRAWFYVMHVMSSILFERAPFKNVLTTGTILAEDGTKMSKSKKNYPDPNLIIEKYGADALRFYLLTSPVVNGEDINFSEKIVAETGRKINMLVYNVWSFYRMYEKSIQVYKETSIQAGNILDQWIISRLNQTHALVTKYMDVFDTVRAGKEIVDFINDLSTWYLRRSRDRIKALSTGSGSASGDDAKQALSTLGFVLVEISKMLAPFTPFLADFIYKDMTGEESVHLSSWSSEGAVDEQILANMEIVREIVTVGLSVRKEKSLAVRQPLAGLAFDFADAKVNIPAEYHHLILEEMNVKIVDANLLDKNLRGEGVVATLGSKAVKNFYLDININPELKKEGVARELERQVQDLRKKSGLKVGELVDVYYNTLDESLEESLLNLVDRKKTFVSQISKSLEVEVDYEIQATVDGKAIWLGIIKI